MLTAKLTAALVIAAGAWPTAIAVAIPSDLPAEPPRQDLRSPDTRDAARAAESQRQDLRSPDTRDAARAAESPRQDLRSPGSRDAAPIAPRESVVLPPSRSVQPVTDEFEWTEAGIGAAVTLALVCAAGGTLLLVSRNRRRAPTT